MSDTLAGPPGECCRQTVQHVGQPRGVVENVAGVETYVARPASGSNAKIILFFGDVYGPMYVNSQLIMDYWAENGKLLGMRQPEIGTHLVAGYLVVGLDYFEGDSCAHHQGEPGWDVDEWVVPFRTSAAQITPPWIEAVRGQYGAYLAYSFVWRAS